MPKDSSIKKVMVIGSGPIMIGQAAEFDYAGTQACTALREEGVSVVLINSNPATIMTDTEMADRVYIEPLNVEFATRVIAQERPDGLLPTLGGQTGLNLATELALKGVLEEYNVKLLGTPLSAIQDAEDRERFRDMMRRINEPVPESWIVENVGELHEVSKLCPYPCIIRPAYTLGGTGGGVAHDVEELIEIGSRGLKLSMRHQVMIERSLLGWKEIEYEVMRDRADSCITICNMENFDPMGIHTGDSIVVAPSQTLSDKEYQMLRSASLRIIRALGIEGGCNVQLAVNPNGFDYYVIEVNPRVSRSSALASKATGYPIARVSAKIAIGLTLDEIDNAVTKATKACFEPALDYIVVKIPRWPFDKFQFGDRSLGTQMKATGEVMSIDRSFESAMMKAIRSLEIGRCDLRDPAATRLSEMELESKLTVATDERLFVLAEAFRRGMTVKELMSLTKIDRWFLEKLQTMVAMEKQLSEKSGELRRTCLNPQPCEGADLLKQAKRMGFPDRTVADFTGLKERTVRQARIKLGIVPAYKMVDTCAAEFEAMTPYYYSCYDGVHDKIASTNPKKVLVIGSGPIRIGQGIEFDYCTVHSVWALREAGYEAIIINNNPETVSTDFDTSDGLYFDPITLEDVLNLIDYEKPEGVIVQFGGQTAINLVNSLADAGVHIFGTPPEAIDITEDRDKFERVLNELQIPKPAGRAVTNVEAAKRVAAEIGYPVLVRPSYVLGGRAMEIVFNDTELDNYMTMAVSVSQNAPVLVDKYVRGCEAETDLICDGDEALIPGIMEHIERAGVHSGDSMAVYPPIGLSERVKDQIVDYGCRIAKALGVRGLMNVQYVVANDQAYVLEVNPRASRTVPYISKVTNVPMVRLATQMMLGHTLKELGWKPGVHPIGTTVAVKAPVFSFLKLTKVDVSLGPEMKSTGEIMGVDSNYSAALYKAMLASGIEVPKGGSVLLTVADADKEEAVELACAFAQRGFRIFATPGTGKAIHKAGIEVQIVPKMNMGSPNLLDMLRTNRVDLLINTPSNDRKAEMEGLIIRRASIEHGIQCLTSLDTAKALLIALDTATSNKTIACEAMSDYVKVKVE
ncbi:MAG: carbamoyl-phosphate synthase large subunit [bacterium]